MCEWTQRTIWLALGLGGPAALLLACGFANALTRILWTIAYVVYLAHVGFAFHEYHHWSHAEAMRHVESRSGFGPGIVFSHLFTLLWGADVLWWWVSPASRTRRPGWLNRVLYGYMAFITFNATVVYATGFMRAAGLLLFALPGAVLIIQNRAARFGAARQGEESCGPQG